MNDLPECRHAKVYQSAVLASFPPQRRWICSICFDEGTEVMGSYYSVDSYEILKKRKESEAKKIFKVVDTIKND